MASRKPKYQEPAAVEQPSAAEVAPVVSEADAKAKRQELAERLDALAKTKSDERSEAIERVLDQKVREFLARDGGGLEVKSIEDDRLLVSYFGACGGCGSSTAGTLRFIQTSLTVALNHEIEVVPVDEGLPD